MSIFKSRKSLDSLYEDEEYFREEGVVNDLKARSLERKKVVAELEREYGSDWKRVLGLSGRPPLETLKSFLKNFKVRAKESHIVPDSNSTVPRFGSTSSSTGSGVPKVTEGIHSPIAKVQGIE
jgi:hypothetical protein